MVYYGGFGQWNQQGQDMAKKRLRATFGDHLRAYRESRGLTQEQLATAAGTTKTTVYRFEAGLRTPNFDMAAALAAALGVSLDKFTADKTIAET